MNDQNPVTQKQLAKIEQAIAAQESLRGVLDDMEIDETLRSLREKRQVLLAKVEGAGAVAQGEGTMAVGERGTLVNGDVGGDVLGAGARKIVNPDPAQAAAVRARTRYLQRVHQQCNVLPLAAMGGEEGVGDEVTLDQVYVTLDTKTLVPLTEEEKRARESEGSFRMRGEGEDARPSTALEVATQVTRLALLGDPGSGKSTFVRQLAACTAAAHLAGEPPFVDWETGLIPVLIILRELAPELESLEMTDLSEARQEERLIETVREFLSARLQACKAQDWDDCLEDVLLAGDILLLLDGLDEVAEACRGRVRRAVGAMLRAYPNLRRVIVTCRVRSYTGPAMLPGFVEHTLAPFDEEKIKQFVAGWYQAQHNLGRLQAAVAQERARDLQKVALEDDLRELASNPMLLTTMALIHQREVGLPRERVRLYSLAVQVLLTRWQKRKGIVASVDLARVLSDDLKLRVILERLAYEAHQGQAERSRAADLERKDLLALLEKPAYLGHAGLAAEFLDYVDQRAGLLVGQGGAGDGEAPKTYTFPHRTFQEYLAGCYMVGEWEALEVYWQHAGEGDAWYLAALLGAEELRYNRRNVKELLNLAYDLASVDGPESEHKWRATLWSGQMAALFPPEEILRVMQGPKSGQAYLKRLKPRLLQILREEPLGPVERAEAGKALGKLGDPRPGVGLREDGLPDIAWCRVPAGPFLMGSSDEDERSDSDEKPQHEQVIAVPYAISRYPITNAQYAVFVQAGGYTEGCYWTAAAREQVWRAGRVKGWGDDEPREGPYDFGEPFNLPNHPVVGVTWYEALAFCQWLTAELRREGELMGEQEVTLPTEPQWEKAARGIDGRSYPWGAESHPHRANYAAAGIGTTSAVGCFPAGVSPYGVEDLSGNVWEWCRTKWEGDYQEYRNDNDVQGTDRRVLRGGAFGNSGRRVRCAYRDRSWPVVHNRSRGFRVVVAPSL
jgi:formylglycine-generating enzyme required for sulfatase activity